MVVVIILACLIICSDKNIFWQKMNACMWAVIPCLMMRFHNHNSNLPSGAILRMTGVFQLFPEISSLPTLKSLWPKISIFLKQQSVDLGWIESLPVPWDWNFVAQTSAALIYVTKHLHVQDSNFTGEGHCPQLHSRVVFKCQLQAPVSLDYLCFWPNCFNLRILPPEISGLFRVVHRAREALRLSWYFYCQGQKGLFR
jgi:hypothetical protein